MAKLQAEDDLVRIYHLQGELECLRILNNMPAEIERLDARLADGATSASMKTKEIVNA